METLIERSGLFCYTKIHYFLFSKTGFTKGCMEKAAEMGNVGFSGGEKKKSEILQLMMLKPDLAILDETDSGLDVDAVRLASEGIREYQKENPDGALLIITHSTRILDALHVDATHIMVNGHIVASGDASLVDKINREGYEEYEKLAKKGEDER